MSVDLQLSMLNVPSWISCVVQLREPAQMLTVEGVEIGLLHMKSMSVPLNSNKHTILEQKNLRLKVTNNEQFGEFTLQLLMNELVEVKMNCSVHVWLFGLVPVFALNFSPKTPCQLRGMNALSMNEITTVEVRHGATDAIEIEGSFQLYNPSSCSFALGEVTFELYYDAQDAVEDASSISSEALSNNLEQDCIGTVIIHNLVLEHSTWNALNATVYYHPPPNSKSARELLSRFANNEASEIYLKGSMESLDVEPHPSGLPYFSPVMSRVQIGSAMPGIGLEQSRLITRCQLSIWKTIVGKNPVTQVSQLVGGRGLQGLSSVDSYVVLQHPFHDKVHMLSCKGDMFLSSGDVLPSQERPQSQLSSSQQSTTTSDSRRNSQLSLQPGMKIGSIDVDVRRDRWIKNKTGIKRVIEDRSSQTDDLESKQNTSNMECIIFCPPYCTVLSPSLPVQLTVNAAAVSAMLSAAVGRLAVDMELIVDCYIGEYFVQGLKIKQLNVAVDVE